jgi:uncharacterized protein
VPSAAEARFLSLIAENQNLGQMLDRLPELALPDTWVVGGCLFQTAWNVLAGHAPDQGIKDYDIFYFDSRNCSSDCEEQARRRAAQCYGDLCCEVDVRNQARVHTWYAQEFGIQGYPQLEKATDGIDNFLAVCCMVGVRQLACGRIELYAPLGVEDLLDSIMRPNPLFQLSSRKAYEKKAARWRESWPTLEVVPFPACQGPCNAERSAGVATP